MGAARTRSLGLKFILVGLVTAALAVPLAFIGVLTWERSSRADTVREEVGARFGGPQTVRGPFIVLPYTVETEVQTRVDGAVERRTETRQGYLVFSAERLRQTVEQGVELRRRAIYETPVFTAEIGFEADFERLDAAGLVPTGGVIDWTRASLVIGLSDLRAVQADIEASLDGRPLDFRPGSPFDRSGWRGVSAPLPGLMAGEARRLSARLSLTGAQSLRLTASGKTTETEWRSDWPHPGFNGAFPPVRQEVLETGHAAAWSIPYIARGAPGAWRHGALNVHALDDTAFGVSLVTPADGYQSVARALKYALFFIGLLMLLFFLMEAHSPRRIHAAQYVLIGLTQTVFYLLLLALSEHVGLPAAYAVSAGATVAVSTAYAGFAFSAAGKGVLTGLALGLVYALQYGLILLEDYALLIGAVLAFLAIASTMFATRKTDWYGVVADPKPA